MLGVNLPKFVKVLYIFHYFDVPYNELLEMDQYVS